MPDRLTVDQITSDQLDALYDERDVYAIAWRSARDRSLVLSDELTRRAPLANQYAAAVARLEEELVAVRSQVDRVRAVADTRLAEDECSEWERHGYHNALRQVRAALDGTERPTT